MAGQILQIKKVHYPLEEAVQKAVEQNIKRDQRLGLQDEEVTEVERKIYTDEATHLLKSTGENYVPEYPDTDHICVLA